MEDTEGAKLRLLALACCLEAGPEGVLAGGEVGHHLAHACCLPFGFIWQLGFADVTS